MKVSPSYMINLKERIEDALWAKYEKSKYLKVCSYIKQWQEEYEVSWGHYETNFDIVYKEDKNIDLFRTLEGIKDDELIIKIAIDLGLSVPEIIYGVPEIKGILADRYEDASSTFEAAYQKVSVEPKISVVMANSALESIIKKICKDGNLKNCDSNDTLYKLACHILKEFEYFPDKNLNERIRNIGSGLMKVVQGIEQIRSVNTDVSHGKLKEDYLIDDELYSKFIINATATVGLFLINFYEKKYEHSDGANDEFDENIPF